MLATPVPGISQTAPANAPRVLAYGGATIQARLTAGIQTGTAVHDCYMVDTKPGSRLVIDVVAEDFTPWIRIARGSLCADMVPSREVRGKAPGPARLEFKSPGGRYLVTIGTTDARGGQYALRAGAPAPTPGETGGDDSVPVPGDHVAMEAPVVDRRVALMQKQVNQRRQAVAVEEARRQEVLARQREEEEMRREQEALARMESEARSQATFNAFMGGVNALGSALAEHNAAREAQQHALNLAAARRQEMAYAREQAEARRAQQQQAQEMAKRQEGYAWVGQQLAKANAYRDTQLAKETDPARRAELIRQSQGALEDAAKLGQREAVLAQTRALNASASNDNDNGSNSSSSSASAQAQQQAAAQQRQQAQAQAQAEQARQKAEQEHQAVARAEQERQVAARAEQQRQQEAQREQFERLRRMSNNSSGGFSTTGLGPAPQGSPGPGSGSQTVSVTHIGGCTANSITARFNLGVLMGDATVSGSWSWQGEAGCTAPSSTRVWLRLQHGSAYGFVAIDPAVPKPGGSFGYNSTGSPDWNQLVCGFNGAQSGGCMSKDNARSLWAQGRVTDVVVAW